MEQKNKVVKEIGGSALLLIIISIILILFIGYKTGYLEKFIKLELVGNTQVELEVGKEYVEPGYKAITINGKDLTYKVKSFSNVSKDKLGEYKILYSLDIEYLNIHKYVYRTVKIVDKTKPELIIDGSKEIKVDIGKKLKYPSYIAKDNFDGDITDKVETETNLDLKKTGTYEINYSVTDSSGNKATDKVTVIVENRKNPYIIVSISKQKLEYYEYGKLALSSNIVTGINGKTPKGTFKVLNKATDIILKGKDYESFVSYWIAFKGSSFGFHDASWRSKFGGSIYKTNGSHGCVNMPYSKVKQLYNLVSIGTPVYIKD